MCHRRTPWRVPTTLLLLIVVALLPGAVAVAQPHQSAAPDPFESVAFLIGRWEGTSEGQPGKGTLRREYERVLNGRFIRVRNRSEYPAQAKNPKGEIHEDEGYVSFDRARKRLVLRQFHVEGFVNQYLQDDELRRTGSRSHGVDREHPCGLASPRDLRGTRS